MTFSDFKKYSGHEAEVLHLIVGSLTLRMYLVKGNSLNRNTVLNGVRVCQLCEKLIIGNGSTIKFWLDHWTDCGPLRGLVSRLLQEEEHNRTMANALKEDGEWD